MKIKVSVCTDEGWQTYYGTAPGRPDLECYALPSKCCRAAFWNRKAGLRIPSKYRALIWEVV